MPHFWGLTGWVWQFSRAEQSDAEYHSYHDVTATTKHHDQMVLAFDSNTRPRDRYSNSGTLLQISNRTTTTVLEFELIRMMNTRVTILLTAPSHRSNCQTLVTNLDMVESYGVSALRHVLSGSRKYPPLLVRHR